MLLFYVGEAWAAEYSQIGHIRSFAVTQLGISYCGVGLWMPEMRFDM